MEGFLAGGRVPRRFYNDNASSKLRFATREADSPCPKASNTFFSIDCFPTEIRATPSFSRRNCPRERVEGTRFVAESERSIKS